MPDTGDDNETACKMFGKTLVKTASGTIVAPTTCNDGDPYTKANDQACYAAGKTACWGEAEDRFSPLNHWVVGEVQVDPQIAASFYPCWRVCAISDACYGDERGALVGTNPLEDLPESMGCFKAARVVHLSGVGADGGREVLCKN